MSMRYGQTGVCTSVLSSRSRFNGAGHTATVRHPDDNIPFHIILDIYSHVSLIGAEIRIYDMDNIPAGSLGTELFGTESNTTSTFPIEGPAAGNDIWIQIMLDGYREYGLQITYPANNTMFYAGLQLDTNA